MEEIPVAIERDIMGESIDSFRNIILDTINQLKSTIDFLENEITEKHLLINTLILRTANDSCQGIDGGVLSKSNYPHVVETTLHEQSTQVMMI